MENMLDKMMKRFPLFIAMGFMIVIISLIIGIVNTTNAVDYYSIEKVTRETLQQWADVRAGVESTSIWLPYFKFLGLAMILAGITMALGVIATNLLKMGKELMANERHVDADVHDGRHAYHPGRLHRSPDNRRHSRGSVQQPGCCYRHRRTWQRNPRPVSQRPCR